MRIISGHLKGRRISAPKKLPVRPTTDRSKEALFNILTNWFEFSEVRVLDLFSGSPNQTVCEGEPIGAIQYQISEGYWNYSISGCMTVRLIGL